MLAKVTSDASEFIQTMNDRYTRPSGEDLANENQEGEQQVSEQKGSATAPGMQAVSAGDD